jgi:glycosyltransferase involved in cell wall biosynthesis
MGISYHVGLGEMNIVQDVARRSPPAIGTRDGSRPAIVHIVTRYLRGGSERRVRDMVRALPEAEHHLVVGGGSDAELAAADIGPTSITVLPSLVRRPDPLRDPIALRRLVRQIRRGGYDLVVTHQSKAGVLGRTAARLCGTPAVHSLSMANFGDGYPRWQSLLFRTVESRLAGATAAYVVVGSDLCRRYAAIGVPPEKMHVIRSGVPLPTPWGPQPSKDEVRRSLGLPDDRPLLLYLGSLEPRKNVLSLPDLLGRLVSSAAPRPYLVVAGNGPLADPLRQALTAAGLADDARLLGFVPDPLPLVRVADVMVLLSSAEGVPQVLVQAAASGTPFVAHEVDGVNELIDLGADGIAVPPGDLEAAASATRSFLGEDRPPKRGSLDLSSWFPGTIAEGYRRVIGHALAAEPTGAALLHAGPEP